MDKSEQDMKTLVFDVMLDGRFIHTFRYQYCPLFPIDEEELEKFVTDRPIIRYNTYEEALEAGLQEALKLI